MRWHLLDRETLESMSYLAGWLASGFAVIGDIRDLGSSLWDGRYGSALLSAAGVLPLVGDAAKTVGVVRKFVALSDALRAPVTRWIARQFADHPSVRRELYQVVGLGGSLDQLDDVTLDALAISRNSFTRLSAIMGSGRTLLRSAALSSVGEAAVRSRITQHWGTALSATQKAEAVAVESAVEILTARGYRLLYVGRPGPVPGTTKHVSQGPDIVAVTPAGRTVVVEAKGAVNQLSINNTRLRSKVDGAPRRQPSRDWLTANAPARYLTTMSSSSTPEVLEAAGRLRAIIGSGADFDAVVVAASPRTSLGKLDDTLEELHADPGVTAEVLRLDIQL